MTKSNNEWVPEIDKEYLLVSMGMCRMNEPVKITYTGKGVGCYERLSDGMEFTYASGEAVFQEIKTEAEKRREERIDLLAGQIWQLTPALKIESAKILAENLIAGNWIMLKPLTEVQKDKLLDQRNNSKGLSFYDLVDLIQRELGVI